MPWWASWTFEREIKGKGRIAWKETLVKERPNQKRGMMIVASTLGCPSFSDESHFISKKRQAKEICDLRRGDRRSNNLRAVMAVVWKSNQLRWPRWVGDYRGNYLAITLLCQHCHTVRTISPKHCSFSFATHLKFFPDILTKHLHAQCTPILCIKKNLWSYQVRGELP